MTHVRSRTNHRITTWHDTPDVSPFDSIPVSLAARVRQLHRSRLPTSRTSEQFIPISPTRITAGRTAVSTWAIVRIVHVMIIARTPRFSREWVRRLPNGGTFSTIYTFRTCMPTAAALNPGSDKALNGFALHRPRLPVAWRLLDAVPIGVPLPCEQRGAPFTVNSRDGGNYRPRSGDRRRMQSRIRV
jgi:hypothetical protein